MINTLQSMSMLSAIRVIAAVLLFQVVAYFGCEKLQSSPHNVEREIDKKIPFSPVWSFVYVMWFPMIAIVPLMLFVYNRTIFFIYIVSIIADIILSTAIYVIYPTTFNRPTPTDTFSGRFMKLIYFCSYKGINCMPSMHCSMCYLIIIMSCICPLMSLWMRFVFIIVATGVVYSTMATKQHTVIDVVTAIPTALVCIMLGYSCSIILF